MVSLILAIDSLIGFDENIFDFTAIPIPPIKAMNK